MRALVIYCHPVPTSFTAAVRDVVLDRLRRAGAKVALIDLYAEGFQPVLGADEFRDYLTPPDAAHPLAAHIAEVRACDTLIFVYPTWWYGMPAMLKGWLDRVLLPGVAFHLPENAPILPRMTHVRRLGVFTTCGASWWLTRFIGAPGRRTLLRGVRLLCARRARTAFAAHYDMDRTTDATRTRHLARVGAVMDKLLARGA